MNIVRSIMDDCEAVIRRIEFELGPHVLFTKAQQSVVDARAALAQHPDAPTGPLDPAVPAATASAANAAPEAVQTGTTGSPVVTTN